MKNIFTNLKKMSLGIFACALFTGNVSATTYTATQSGNWSSALTWGGAGSPGSTISSIDNVVIPAGITVTLDMDVTVSSVLSSINVSGGLTTTTNSLTVTQGTLEGSGIFNLMYLEVQTLGTFSVAGTLTAQTFVNSGATISVGSSIIISDSLLLNSGSISFNAGSSLNMNTSSTIKINAGTITVSGGALSATSNYDVIYIGGSKTSGVETGISMGVHNVWINMTDSTQIVTMGNDITVNGTMYHTKGIVTIGTHTLKLMGDYISTVSGKLQASSTSRLMLELSNTSSSTILLSSGTQFQYLEVNSSSSPTIHFIGNLMVDTIYVKSGLADFTNPSMLSMTANGMFIWENGMFSLSANDTFDGTNSYSVEYLGVAKTSSYEITGSGLQNVTVNMNGTMVQVNLFSDLTVNGAFNLNKGSFNLNSRSLYLKGTYTSTMNGAFKGTATSNIFVNNAAVSFGDTLNFESGFEQLDTLSINTMASAWVWLGTSLNVSKLAFQSGSLMLMDGDLTINSAGPPIGFDTSKYVGMSGSGSLVMNVNVATGYVTFPVGTNVGYSGVAIELISGTSGNMGVNVQNGMLSNGTTGTNLALTQSVVNRTWDIHTTQTGTLSANLKLDWNITDEKNGFDRTHAYTSHYISSDWDAIATSVAPSIEGNYYQMTRSNLSSWGQFAVVDQSAVTGIEKVTATDAIMNVYPNPASNFFTIDLRNESAKSIEVYDEIGNKVISTENVNKNSVNKVDVSSLPAGVYYVKVATTTAPIIKKLIKS